jgi:hypothetical protein
MRLNPFGTSATSRSLIPATDDGDNICDSEAASEMQIGIGNRITRTIPALMPVWAPKIPRDNLW